MLKISVIVPCFNLARWIASCLDSVLVQDFQNWECVVVDDESTDDCPQILDEYAARDKRIRVIHQKNKGEGGARNSGIVAAKGEWFFFLDGDDTMAPGALAHLNQIIEKYPDEKLIRFGYEQFQDGTNWVAKGVRTSICRKLICDSIQMSDFFTYVWQHLYKRDLICDLSFKGYKRGCDRVFIDDVLINRVNSFVESSACLYGYRMRAGSAINSHPSVQVLKDELSHRLDIIEMIDASSKDVPYRHSDWLEWYCRRGYQQLVFQKEVRGNQYCYSDEERKQLVNWFYCELPRLLRAKDYSMPAKIDMRLYSVFHNEFSWFVISRVLPFVSSFVRLIFTDPLRIWRAGVRKIHR